MCVDFSGMWNASAWDEKKLVLWNFGRVNKKDTGKSMKTVESYLSTARKIDAYFLT